jgi:hypothetical protein
MCHTSSEAGCVTADLVHLIEPTELETGQSSSLLLRDAPVDVIGHLAIEMNSKLGVELVLQLPGPHTKFARHSAHRRTASPANTGKGPRT